MPDIALHTSRFFSVCPEHGIPFFYLVTKFLLLFRSFIIYFGCSCPASHNRKKMETNVTGPSMEGGDHNRRDAPTCYDPLSKYTGSNGYKRVCSRHSSSLSQSLNTTQHQKTFPTLIVSYRKMLRDYMYLVEFIFICNKMGTINIEEYFSTAVLLGDIFVKKGSSPLAFDIHIVLSNTPHLFLSSTKT